MRQKAFMYYYKNHPGLGILASHEFEGWQRVNFYAYGVDMDDLQKGIEEDCEATLLQEKVIAARPAQSKVIIAGGVVFKGLTCLTGEGVGAQEVMGILEKEVSDFRVLNAEDMLKVDSINPLELYSYIYKNKVLGISRVIFFEYATQMSMAGIYRDQDHNLVDELSSDLSALHEYMTVPNPLRTDEKDPRVEVNMFMIRSPLKEELQADYVDAIFKIQGLTFLTI